MIVIRSPAANWAPGRKLITPVLKRAVICIENADGDRPEPALERHVEQALLEHQACAVAAFLAGLEVEQDAAGEPGPPLDQQPRRAQQHRDVRVVAAGVHRPVDLRREVEVGRLEDRQRVHVGSEEDGRAGRAAVDQRGDGAEPPTEPRGEAQPLQLVDDERLGLGQIQADLGPPVESAPERDNVRVDRSAATTRSRARRSSRRRHVIRHARSGRHRQRHRDGVVGESDGQPHGPDRKDDPADHRDQQRRDVPVEADDAERRAKDEQSAKPPRERAP